MLHSTGHLQQAQLKIEKQNFNKYSHIAYNTWCYYESTIVKQIIFKPVFYLRGARYTFSLCLTSVFKTV